MEPGSPADYRATGPSRLDPMRSLPLVAIRRRAILALLLLTALIGGSFAVQRLAAERQERTSRVIDMTQRQAVLTERIALLAQTLGSDITDGQRAAARGRLGRSITLMADSHRALLDGDAKRGLPAENNPAVLRAYRGTGHLDAQVKDFLAHARAVVAKSDLEPRDADLGYVRAAAQTKLLESLNGAAALQQSGAKADRDLLSRIEM